MKRFYVDLLGFAVEWEPIADNVYLSSGIDNLALHRSRAHRRVKRTTATPTPERPSRAVQRPRSSRSDRAVAPTTSIGGRVSGEPRA